MLSDTAFWLTMRVYIEDTDCTGVVYHANYLRYLERARTDWLRHIGSRQSALGRELDLCFAVTELDIRYRQPARLDDTLHVGIDVAERGRASLWFTQCIRRDDPQGPDLVTARVRVAALTQSRFKPRRLPDFLRSEG